MKTTAIKMAPKRPQPRSSDWTSLRRTGAAWSFSRSFMLPTRQLWRLCKQRVAPLVLVSLVMFGLYSLLSKECNKPEASAATSWELSPLGNVTFRLPGIYDMLTHMRSGVDAGVGVGGASIDLAPRVFVGGQRRARFVIGVPTARRVNAYYLEEMIYQLLSALSDEELSQVLIVVFIADYADEALVDKTMRMLHDIFPDELRSGLLDVISAPAAYYPDLSDATLSDAHVFNVFNDTLERVRWRTKQNYDMAYLMSYAAPRAQYYLQLEDDVASADRFINEIVFVIGLHARRPWMMIEFSPYGFIGKLFRASHLPLFVHMFLMFASARPVDYLHETVLRLVTCRPEDPNSVCAERAKAVKVTYSRNLFQHFGVRSSLRGKTQMLNLDFKKSFVSRTHVNPNASLATSLRVYETFTLESVYSGEDVLWALPPRVGDFIQINFTRPVLLTKYVWHSGSPPQMSDTFPANTTLEVFPVEVATVVAARIANTSYELTDDAYVIIERTSVERRLLKRKIVDPTLLGPVTHVRIRINSPVNHKLQVSEIMFN